MPNSPSQPDAECAIELLLAAWSAPRPPAEVRRTMTLAYGPVMFTHVAHVHRLAEGVLTLYRADQMLVAMPLVRQIIETSVRAVWLETFRENLPAVLYDGERQRRRMLEEAVSTNQIPEDSAILESTTDWCDQNQDVPGATSGEVFERICQEIEGARGVYAHYRAASNYVHPGSILIDSYVDVESLDEPKVSFTTNPQMPVGEAWLNYTAYLLILTGLVWDRLDNAKLHRALLRRLAVEFDVPTRALAMTAKGFGAWVRADRDRKRRDRTGPRQDARIQVSTAARNVSRRTSALDGARVRLRASKAKAQEAGLPEAEILGLIHAEGAHQ